MKFKAVFLLISVFLPFAGFGQGLKLLTPGQGDSFEAGQKVAITWNASDAITAIALSFSFDNKSWLFTINSNAPNIGSYAWTVPYFKTGKPQVWIRIAAVGINLTDSIGPFAIAAAAPDAAEPNLGPGTASYTVVPAVVEMPIFDGPVGARFGATAHGAVLPECRIESDGRTIRYFISQPMSVSVEILGANGRLVQKIPGSRRTAGWHPVSPASAPVLRSNGVYIVRLSAEGRRLAVKRVMLLRD
jgi:hypothetical protein